MGEWEDAEGSSVHRRDGSKGGEWKRIRLYRESREGGHSERGGDQFGW